jgi:ABC-2 type transport system permease protein
MTELVAAEWLKLRTTRLLHGTVPAAVGLSVAAVAGMALADHAPDLSSAEAARRVLSVAGAGAVVVLVIGILVSAGEYRHGTAGDTFLTTPRRRSVLAAKLTVAAIVGTAVGVLTGAACVVAAIALYRPESTTLQLTDADVWLVLPATAAYTGLFATLGVGLGAVIRNQVAAVAVALAWIAIIEHTLVNLAPSIGRWLPAGAGQAILRTPIDGLLSPPAAVVVLAAYTALATLSAARLEERRDV